MKPGFGWLAATLLLQSALGAVPGPAAAPRWPRADNGSRGALPFLPAGFHQENTVTNDLILEDERGQGGGGGGEEEEDEEDYLDLDKLLRGDDDEDYADVIDAVPEADLASGAGNVLQLFQGKTRLQRLNILNARFAFQIYRTLRDGANGSANVLLAPVGISTAMSMVSLGLRGRTQQQLLEALGFQDFINASSSYDGRTVHGLFRKLTHRLFRRDFGFTLRAVNDLYVRKGVTLLDGFQSQLRDYYFAEAQPADFADPAFVAAANRRVRRLTKGLIKEALADVNPATLMMILNCLYFKGTWENKFPAEMTHKRNFRLNEREVVKVPMMQTKGNFLAANDQVLDCDVLQLPYVGNISMMVVVPHKLAGMRALESQLTPRVVDGWRNSMTNRTREVLLPQFKLEKKYNLVETLKAMGITDLFDQKGDYSGMSDGKIIIDQFNHQGTITVNEEGTQAAAVTTVGFMPLSTQVRFIVDRPFLFLIYEHRTDCLLFMGRVANPSRS
ncbi:heparin cofactor 2 [Tachyglossus aculeatus]|uniref:heparin cofactor 2 n=1 Tax=Tachyglossus aculeatus TaxID=9261 RepID=UPI0018F409D6|nr:heparin cofactor 2 [Tachyglossus aculeatus]